MGKRKAIAWLLMLYLVLCAADVCAEVEIIEDCGECAGHVLSGSNAVTVISGRHDITLHQAIIDASDQENTAAFSICPGAEVFLTLEGENILLSGENCAGLQVPSGAKLCMTEESTGSVTALGGMHGAGIGGGAEQSSGEIRISGGTVVAETYDNNSFDGAGIGGGMNGGFETIVISGGTVYAEGNNGGIGGNGSGICGRIEISGGVVYAVADCKDWVCAAIGSASENMNGEITISGGTVYAVNDSYYDGIAIGCNGGTIRFDGGRVYAMNEIRSDSEHGKMIVTDGVVSVNGVLLERTDEN